MADAARRRYEMAKPDAAPGSVSRRLDVPATPKRKARTVTLSLEQLDGKPVVIYMDVPAGLSAPIDVARMTIDRPPTGR
jgi:hypothetical protein